MNKVFCKKCKYLLTKEIYLSDIEYDCIHSNNREYKRNWLNPYFLFRKKPSKINKNNNCLWYQEIEYKDEISIPNPPTTEDCIESDS